MTLGEAAVSLWRKYETHERFIAVGVMDEDTLCLYLSEITRGDRELSQRKWEGFDVELRLMSPPEPL